MPDPLFQKLFDDTETVRWAPTGVIRDRARQRVRRTRLTAVVATVVAICVISAGVALAQLGGGAHPQPGISGSPSAGPQPSPSVSPGSATPTPSAAESTAIAGAMLFQPADVGSGYRITTGGQGSYDWTFEFSTSALGCEQTRPIQDIARQDRSLSRGTPSAEDSVTQYVARYRSGDAARYLDQVRARVSACTPANGQSIGIGAERFAGQDALLIEVDYGGGFTTKHVLVRQGDLLTEFFTKPARTNAATEELGRTAAQRLCAGTPIC